MSPFPPPRTGARLPAPGPSRLGEPPVGRFFSFLLAVVTGLALAPAPGEAQSCPGIENGEWRYWGGDTCSRRYAPLDQITAENFGELQEAWLWRGDNFGPRPDVLFRATPTYADGILYTVAGERRTAVAIDPATGETLWTFREPHTVRWERSMRKNYGKGVSYAEVDGRGVIYLVTPGFFLWALDAKNGRPLRNWGTGVDLPGFPEDHGVVDLIADLDEGEYDVCCGFHEEHKVITNSSAPMVVNGVVVVGNSHEQGYYQYRQDNVPGDILAYDAATGEHLWRFDVVPDGADHPGFESWENDAWKRVGNASSWAPMSADPELGLVYVVTDGITVDYYKGFAPGDNLFSTSILALEIETGGLRWHYQTVHHDVWNYDNPTAPNLLDITVDGERVPALIQTTKQNFAYVLDRRTGEPVWPIEERPVPQSDVPGEKTSPTQPFPTKPAPYGMQGITEDDLIDFTPELREKALEIASEWRLGPLFNPPALPDEEEGIRGSIHCPGANGGTNIPGGAVTDPSTGMLYVAVFRGCSAPQLRPATEWDDGADVRYATRGPGGVSGPDGLPLLKPPYGRITAIDMNTGEHAWWIPNGETPEFIKNHEALRGVDLPNTGERSHATKVVTETLLIYGSGRGTRARLYAVDKKTGETLATIELPGPTQGPPMTYMHEGKQYIAMGVSNAREGLYGSIVALALP